MSCPTDDIHSIYLDGELPLAYIKEYETHIENCPSCKAKLDSLKKLKDSFKADSKNISLDQKFMDESYDRLLTKMHYAKNANAVREFKLPVSETTLRWGMGAAAAVIIAAVLPVTISNAAKSNADTNNVASITPVARPQSASLARQNVVINGNLDSRMAQTVSTGNNSYQNLPDVDVLRPEFDDSRKIQLNITVPGLGDENNQTFEINLPVNSNEGQLDWNRHRR